jgi:succinyl-diaminopimelate desuccinylase
VSRQQLLDWIEADRATLVDFLSRFIRAKSPNPPGDTREAVGVIRGFLDAQKLEHRIVAPQADKPNVIAHLHGGQPGRHLVLNGHVDVFPAIEPRPGERDQWSGAVEDGKIYGRGVADMKCGTTASIFTFAYLARLKNELKGRLTLTCVSDEETGGRWGTRYLMENHADEVLGDCCLNGEPSGITTVRFGEKGTFRVVLTARTAGAHGAYPHLSKSATKIIGKLMGELEALETLQPNAPDNIVRALSSAEVRAATDASLGKGAADVVQRLTVNVGVLRGGLKVNVLPDECAMELDIRMPIGLDRPAVEAALRRIVAGCPEVTLEVREDHSYPSSWCDPAGEMAEIVRDNAERLNGVRPQPIVSLGGSDGRYWRWRDRPAYLFGPSPITMGRRDEHVTIGEFLHVVRTHALSAYDYLSR